jgi:hypothetical protein
MKVILTVIISLLLITCRNNKETVKSTSVQTSTPQSGSEEKLPVVNETPAPATKPEKFGLVVIFYSIGEGAEFQYISAFEDSIKNYSGKINKNIDYQRKAWGREGETDFCVPLIELTKQEKEEFISKIKATLKSAKWVNIFENHDCPKRGGE